MDDVALPVPNYARPLSNWLSLAPADDAAPRGPSRAALMRQYFEAAPPSEAALAQQAREAAAARTRRSVAPEGGREESGATDAAINMVVPGRGIAQAAYAGDYPDAALETAATIGGPALRAVPPAVRSAAAKGLAGILGGAAALAPSNGPAEAEASAFPFITDATERAAADNALNAIKVYRTNPNGRTLHDAKGNPLVDENATAQKRSEFVTQSNKDYATRAGAAKAGQDLLKSFTAANAETVKGLTPAQRAEFDAAVADTPENTVIAKKDVLTKFAQDAQREAHKKEIENQPFVQRYPAAAMTMEGLSIAGGLAAPGHVAFSRAGRLMKASDAGRAALAMKNAPGKAARLLAGNDLEAFGKLRPFDKAELVTAPLLPWATNTVAPAAIDAFRFNGDFNHPALKSDMESLNPLNENAWKRLGVNAAEGVAATGAGLLAGGFARNYNNASTQAGSTLKTIRDVQAAEAEAATAKAAERAAKTAAITSAKKPTRSRAKAAPAPGGARVPRANGPSALNQPDKT